MQEVVTACWNTIGVHGDSSCAELKQVVHCRNCPVYSQAATKLLDGEPPAEYVAHWTEQARRTKNIAERKTVSVLIFRIGSEWFALQATVLTEIANLRPIHSLPHRRNGIVLGIANIRGELIVCVSLRGILSVDAPDAEAGNRRDGVGRMLVMQRDGACAVCPVDEVHGIERFVAQDLGTLPATVGGAAARYTCATLLWAGRTVGVLDERMLFQAVTRSIA
ncbi:MAG: chemotaxis protein CheW [Steroidobacteraceae bacterium]